MKALAYLLAAGKGRRAGGPKAWKKWSGRPLLERQVDFLLKRLPAASVFASIQADWKGRCAQIAPDLSWVTVSPDIAPLGALQECLKASPRSGWAFVYHVDMPVWEHGLFDVLARRAETEKAEALVPVHQARRGHPVLLSPKAQEAIRALDPARDRLDAWLRTRPVAEVSVAYACVRENWNGDETEPTA